MVLLLPNHKVTRPARLFPAREKQTAQIGVRSFLVFLNLENQS